MRNKELQSIIIQVIAAQLFIGFIVFGVVNNYYINKINTSIVVKNQALVGNLLNKYPELEAEIIPYITKEISQDNIEIGKETLSKYGYNTEINILNQPILNDIMYSQGLAIVIITFLSLIILVFIINREYGKIYSKVRKVYTAAEKVVEGEFDVYLNDKGEGEFNILNRQFNMMANRLENSLETLKREKVFLKNTISDISHQLKTPLSSLIMFNELMINDEKMNEETRSTFLERSKTQLERMEWLILNLLKVAKIEAGAIIFKKDKVYLKDVAELALETLKSKLIKKDISIEITKDLNGVFYGDKEWTIEALINIFKNAIEHSYQKSSIEIKIEETPLFSSIAIRDYGQGIDKKDIPKIFKRFYKGSSGSKLDSIGIGLNLSKVIIESQDGSISVESKKGKGTIFRISFLKGYSNLTK